MCPFLDTTQDRSTRKNAFQHFQGEGHCQKLLHLQWPAVPKSWNHLLGQGEKGRSARDLFANVKPFARGSSPTQLRYDHHRSYECHLSVVLVNLFTWTTSWDHLRICEPNLQLIPWGHGACHGRAFSAACCTSRWQKSTMATCAWRTQSLEPWKIRVV